MNALTVNGKQLTIDGVEIIGYDNSVPYTLLYENDNTYTGASTGTPTTFDDASCELIVDSSAVLPTTVWSK